MRWSGQARDWWSAFFLPRTRFDYAREIGDGRRSNIVVACINWIARTFPEAPVQVVEEKPDGVREIVPGHEMARLIEKPNDFYSGVLLWKATAADCELTGNGYWLKIRSELGKVVQLWWAPSFTMEPKWPDDGLTYISHYEYKPDPGRAPIPVDPRDVVHFRDDIDPDNTRKGRSQFACLMREIFTDEEAANFTASLMRNLGVPGVMISPKQPGNAPDEESAKNIKTDFKANFGGDNRGDPMVMSVPVDVTKLSFSPEEMNLTGLRRIPEERVTAVIGVAAVVVGLGAGLDRSTFTNFAEAREAAYEGKIIPMQRLRAADLKLQLLPDFDADPALDVQFDLSRVRVLQPDLDKLATRMNAGVLGGWAMVSDARRAMSLPVGPEHDVFLRPVNMVEVPAGASQKERCAAVKEAKRANVAARRTLAKAYRPLIAEVAAKLVRQEQKDVMGAATKAWKDAGSDEFDSFIAAYYGTGSNFGSQGRYVRKQIAPVLLGYGSDVQDLAAAEVGGTADKAALAIFIAAYLDSLVGRWVGSSRGQLEEVAKEAIAAGTDPIAALQARFDEWTAKRPEKLADWETKQTGNAVTVETYKSTGMKPTFSAGAESCPICQEADGQPVSEVGYAPLHDGCDCDVTAA
jgi:HK97 family phage portal protein